MSSLLGLNYYDDEDDEQQSDNDGVTAEQRITVTAKDIPFEDSGEDREEAEKSSEPKNSASISQAIVNNVAERGQPRESPKRSLPQAQPPQKSLTSPSAFSNLVRRKSNNTTPHNRQRDGDSSLPKLDASPGIDVNTSSPPSDQLGKHVDDNNNNNNNPSIPMEIEMPPDELEDFQQKIAMRRLLTPKPIEGTENWRIPPEPETECVQTLQEKIAHFHQLKSKGIIFNETLSKNKAFRNPHIYNKLVEFVELDEIGSNFDRETFDPYGFPPESFADQLAEAQRRQAEERQQQQQRSQIQFVGSSSNSQGISKARHVMQSLAAREERGSSTATNTVTSTTSIPAPVPSQTLPNVNDATTVSSRAKTGTSGKKRASKWDVPAPNVVPPSSSASGSRHHNSSRSGHDSKRSRT